MKRTALLAAALLALIAFAEAPSGAIQIDAKTIVWKDGPPSLAKGTKSAVLEGDPKSAGIFTMRLRVPAGAHIPPHWHPRAERVTILSGHVQVGFGDKWDHAALRSFHAGDFYVNRRTAITSSPSPRKPSSRSREKGRGNCVFWSKAPGHPKPGHRLMQPWTWVSS
jgi:quercetin dioxygenase-like cupin family protein